MRMKKLIAASALAIVAVLASPGVASASCGWWQVRCSTTGHYELCSELGFE